MTNDHDEAAARQPRISRRNLMTGAAATAAATAGAVMMGASPAQAQSTPDNHGGGGGASGSADADLVLTNGRFLTMDRSNTVADWIAVSGGRITGVGHGRAPVGGRRIDLRGATAIPGLIDSHVHFIRDGVNPGHEVREIETAATIDEFLAAISDRAKSVPRGDFITCIGGWNRNGVAERRLPTISELDKAAPRNPVYLSETSGGGAGVTNTAGAAFFTAHGVGVVNGVVSSTSAAQAALVAVQTDADRQRGTAEAIAFVNSLGMTMVHDQGGLTGLGSYRYSLDLWQQQKLNLRIRYNHNTGYDTGISLMQARIDNNLNRLGDDYYRPIGIGERVNTVSTSPLFVDACAYVAQNDWTMTQHSLTPQEVEFHISSYEATAANGAALGELRWSLCHVNPITAAQIARVKKLGIALNIQGYAYLSAPATPASFAGPPFRDLLRSGIPIGGGSDATNVTAINPWLQMSYMTTGRNNAGQQINDPAQSLSRLDALRLYTIGSTYLSFDEGVLGSLETGKIADITVLSDDPLRSGDSVFKKITSQLTIVGGSVVSKSGAFAHI